ncbi:MAG TPA: hypothetical protein VJI66_01420 [Candidatus Paceibacterota bacterium]
MKPGIKFRESLFWDTNPDNIDLEKNAPYVIERIADLGRDDEVRWLWNFYDKTLMKKVILKSRCLRPETKALWTLLLQTN